MNLTTVSVPFNEKFINVQIRTDLIKSNKCVDLQTINEILRDNVYQVRKEDLVKDRIVIDLGANIGIFSLQAAALGAAKIYAFEPNPENIMILNENIFNNNFETIIQPIIKAVVPAESEGLQKMKFTDNDRDSRQTGLGESLASELALEHAIPSKDNSEFEAEIISLETFFSEEKVEEIDILKCDIEWGEYPLFNSLQEDILNRIKYLVIEFHGVKDDKEFGGIVANLTRFFAVNIIGSYGRGGYIYARRY